MSGMFDFLLDMGNYEERKVDRHEEKGLIVSTAAVSDGKQPYETAVSSSKYNNGKWVIVEGYNTKKEAQEGHNKWVETMTKNPPSVLKDCKNAAICDLISDELEFPNLENN